VLLRTTHWEPGEHHWKLKGWEQHGRMMKTQIFLIKKNPSSHHTPPPKEKKKKR
jgi:hypothetical protein